MAPLGHRSRGRLRRLPVLRNTRRPKRQAGLGGTPGHLMAGMRLWTPNDLVGDPASFCAPLPF